MPDIFERYSSPEIDPLVAAVFVGDMESILDTEREQLIAHLEARDECQRTPIMIAAWYSRRDLVDFLRDAGADLFAVDQDSQPVSWYFDRMGTGANNDFQRLSMRGQVMFQTIMAAAERTPQRRRNRGEPTSL